MWRGGVADSAVFFLYKACSSYFPGDIIRSPCVVHAIWDGERPSSLQLAWWAMLSFSIAAACVCRRPHLLLLLPLLPGCYLTVPACHR
jgi:hypothetical protein